MTKTIKDLIAQQERYPAALSVDEVTRIVQHCKALREALEPFKGVGDEYLTSIDDAFELTFVGASEIYAGADEHIFTLGDLRRVDKVLGE